MTPRQRRMTLVVGIVAGVSVAGALALNAFRENVTFYFNPTEVSGGKVPAGERFRLGGMVTKGSVQHQPGSQEWHFTVTDFNKQVSVTYNGVLPDLFREGRLNQDSVQARIGIQFSQQREQLAFARLFGQDVRFGNDSEFGAGLLLASDVNLGRRILAHAHKREAGYDPACLQRGDAPGQFALNLRGYGAAINDGCHVVGDC